MAEITSKELLRALYLLGKEEEILYVAYRSGERAMRSTIGDVAVLARHGHVFGVMKRGKLTSVRLTGSIHAAYRVLHSCRLGSESRPLGITSRRAPGLYFDPKSIDIRRVDLGITGSYRRLSIGKSTREVTI